MISLNEFLHYVFRVFVDCSGQPFGQPERLHLVGRSNRQHRTGYGCEVLAVPLVQLKTKMYWISERLNNYQIDMKISSCQIESLSSNSSELQSELKQRKAY